MPTGHVEHEVLPLPAVEVPGGQPVHKGAPEAFEKVPSAQRAQGEPLTLVLPGAHRAQSV